MNGNDSVFGKLIRKYKEKLLESSLSRRNKDLYFKPSKGLSLNLSEYDFPEIDEFDESEKASIKRRFCEISISNGSFQKLIEEGVLDLGKHYLLKDVKNRFIVKKIEKLRREDNKYQREFGISGAWIFGPMVCWKHEDFYEGEVVITPLFKIPIDLKKRKNLDWLFLEDVKLEFNPSLVQSLKKFFFIDIDQINLEDKSIKEITECIKNEFKNVNIDIELSLNIKSIPNRISKKSKSQPDQKHLQIHEQTSLKKFIITDCFYIDTVSASKLVLLKDYSEIEEVGVSHPIIYELLSGGHCKSSELKKSMSKLNEYKERDNIFVADIDSSQHKAILSVSNSNDRAVVIKGPPGTGKSQTITNIIADCLDKGKTVLFVSEKRAALDVVHTNLVKANLDGSSVLLHSSDLNKGEVYKSFLQQYYDREEFSTDIENEWAKTCSKLEEYKSNLNDINLFKEQHRSGLSLEDVLSLYSQLSKLSNNEEIRQVFPINNVSELEEIKGQIENLESSLNNFGKEKYFNHSWQRIKKNYLASNDKKKIFKIVDEYKDQDEKKNSILLKMKSIYKDYEEIIEKRKSFSKIDHLILFQEKILPILFNKEGSLLLKEYLNESKKQREVMKKYLGHYNQIVKNPDQDKINFLEEYFKIQRSIWDSFTKEGRKVKQFEKECLNPWVKKQKSRPYEGYKYFLTAWEKILSIASMLQFDLPKDKEPSKEWIEKLQQTIEVLILARSILEQIEKIGLDSPNDKNSFLNTLQNIQRVFEHETQLDPIRSSLKQIEDQISEFVLPPDEISNELEMKNWFLKLKEEIDDTVEIDRINLKIGELENEIKGFRSLLKVHLRSSRVSWCDIVESEVIQEWHEEILRTNDKIRTFCSREREEIRKKYASLLQKHQSLSQEKVKGSISQNINDESLDGNVIARLEREAKKKRKVLSPREMMEKGFGPSMMTLKPCWLMSPLSISQMLPNTAEIFDVIIFDEASQVRVEEAIPSIFRAKKMIVVGDDKQMPPTNFFSTSSFESDEDDVEDEPLEESILDLACLCYPEQMLSWHYRSRSEALIAFSNRAFYGGRLIAAPNPHCLTKGGAITFKKVDNAYFSKSGNKVEAKQLVDHLQAVLSKRPDKSVGIIAFGVSQQKAIEDEILIRSEKDKEFRKLYDEYYGREENGANVGLFVKNLENVQGDERDIIFLSVGYAPQEPGGKMARRFGPLSVSGGERRLNVAITRAKEQVIVYCSFNPGEFSIEKESSDKNFASTCFIRYLHYVKNISDGNLIGAQNILNLFGVGGQASNRKGSRFNVDVKRVLEEKGYSVVSEVGSNGFYIDLAIQHPEIPKNYILGIECDGAIFHSSPYARERDRSRQILLESRGWNIYRIWSRDWSQNREEEITKLVKKIEDVLQKQLRYAS